MTNGIQLGALGKHIIATKSDFDTRTYGYKKLSDLSSISIGSRPEKTEHGIFVRRALD